jgi:hypothetical protein
MKKILALILGALLPAALLAIPVNIQKDGGALTQSFTVPSGVSISATGTGTISATSVTGLSVATGKTLTVSNTLTFTGTDSSSVNFGAGGTVLYSGGSYVSSITGTTNRISASASTGAVTLDLTGPHAFSSLTANAVLLGNGTSPIQAASDLSYSTPTLTAPSGFTISSDSSQFTTASNKSAGTYTPTASAIADYSAGGVGWRFTRPDDGTYIHAIYSYNTASGTLNNLALSSRNDFVFTTGGSPDTATEKMRLKSAGNLLIGGTTDPGGSGGLKAFGTTEATTGGAGTILTDGGIYAAKKIISASGTASTGTTSGSLIISGGAGFSGNVNVGGNFSINGYNASRAFNITADSSSVDFFAFTDTRSGGFARTWLWGPGAGVSHGVGFRDSTGSTNVLGIFDGAATNPYQVRALSTTDATTGGAGALATDGGIYAAKKIITASTITVLGGATFLTTSSALTDGAGASTATFTNAPAAGNPTKWIGINDNGTTRYIPAF